MTDQDNSPLGAIAGEPFNDQMDNMAAEIARLTKINEVLLSSLESVVELKAGQVLPNAYVFKKCTDAIKEAKQ